MIEYVALSAGLTIIGFLTWRAGRIWIDASRRDLDARTRLGWALRGTLFPADYWWKVRLDAMTSSERDALLSRETESLGLKRADSQGCPLCGSEIPGAWSLTAAGEPAIARGPIRCPDCDFRLDACRHCKHFLPGAPQGWGRIQWHHDDLTSGRCGHYKTSQPVEQACAPDMARQMKERGYDQVRAPRPIRDSFLPPSSCRAFQVDRWRLRSSEIPWPDARLRGLLRLLPSPAASALDSSSSEPDAEEQWLL